MSAMQADALLPLPVFIPLIVGAIAALARNDTLRRWLALGAVTASLAAGLLMLVVTSGGEVFATSLGGYTRGIAIPLVVDTFSALLLTVMSLLTLACLFFAWTAGDDRNRIFAPMVLVMTAGVNGALLTGDLFNLFVCIEVMLMPSYVLMMLRGRDGDLRATRIYIAVSLLASTLMIGGVALVYAVAGTVNMAALIGAATESAPMRAAIGVVLLALAVKAAVFPVYSWVPRTYPHTSPVITALFSGLLTKVGVYACYRIVSLLWDGAAINAGVIGTVAVATMVLGVLGAVGQSWLRDILAFHMVSQVGYILLGLVLYTVFGLGAAIFYFVQYVVVKTSLLLSCGAVEVTYGTGALSRLGGLARRDPWTAVAFLAASLSLAGVPPFSGFIGKLMLLWAAVLAEQPIVAVAIVAVSLFTLLSMIKIWKGAFWGEQGPELLSAGEKRVPRLMSLPALALAALSLVLGLAAQPVIEVAEVAAAGLLNTNNYREAVLGP